MLSDARTEELQRLEEISRIGDSFENFVNGEFYQVLDKYIFQTLDKGAFEAFKKVDPKDEIAIIETQKMSQIIGKIKSEINKKIQEGKLAKHQILMSNPNNEEDSYA